jgi:hypothetical protein
MRKAFLLEELERRQSAFMEIWREMLLMLEQEVQMPYEKFSHLV